MLTTEVCCQVDNGRSAVKLTTEASRDADNDSLSASDNVNACPQKTGFWALRI